MANTLSGVNLAAIADEAIEYLGSSFFPVGLFTSNFSKDIAQKGESVTTRIISSVAAADLSSGYDGASQDVTSTSVTVTLNQFYGFVAGFTDLETSKAGDPKWLMEHFYEPSREATVKQLVDTMLGLVTAANFTNATTKTAAQFDPDVVADLGANLSNRKVPKAGRSLLLANDYYASLAKSFQVEDASAYGDNAAIRDGVVGRLRGFNVIEYEAIPGNSENLKGIACHPSALALAVRPVTDPTQFGNRAPISVENRIEPNTGLPFQFRLGYRPNTGKFIMSCGFLFGVSKGQGNSLERIKSA